MTSVIACVGCGGLVPDIEGPTHRYIGASPGCWAMYTELNAGSLPPSPMSGLAVDAYAIQHPGVPGPQSTASVWTHLVALELVLEEGWRAGQAIRLRAAAADAIDGWPWLEPPASMGAVTVVDVAGTPDAERLAAVERWVHAAWSGWRQHHAAVRERARAVMATPAARRR
ncbi:MAG: DUF5946 family protein [Chloroflexota bacterium]